MTKSCWAARSMLGCILAVQVCALGSGMEFPLISDGKPVPLVVSEQEAAVVHTAVEHLANDIESICGTKPKVIFTNRPIGACVVVGCVEKSPLLRTLEQSGLVDLSKIRGKWETFTIKPLVISAPGSEAAPVLIVAGSDPRGTAYGVFEISRRMNVSPWYWWADVPIPRRTNLVLNLGEIVEGPPAVKFRGIFINDEDWGLHPWAAKHMDRSHGCIGPNTYARVFELMLRLRANLIWPAMHPCTKAFFAIPENAEVAKKYAIVIGSSHCEPMLRNNVYEWSVNFENEYGVKPGPWDYTTNAEQILRYWADRVRATTNMEVIYTIGMRGIHDSGMPGPKDLAGRVRLLQKVIQDQRQMIESIYGKPASCVPQMFCPYKEVLTIYRAGLQVPDDVIICWSDDNHGYLRPMATPEELRRPGGSGIYYHFSYWGAPADYLWLSTISPALIAFEMHRAISSGATNLWVFNVGDIKPAEWEITFAMDLAWNPHKWHPTNAMRFLEEFAREHFGEALAARVVELKTLYYQLATRGKPEHINRVRFDEPELRQRLLACERLFSGTTNLASQVPTHLRDCFFQLVEYPLVGAALLNMVHLHARLAEIEANRGNPICAIHAAAASNAYYMIRQYTRTYNTGISAGKWSDFMDPAPRNLAVFKLPDLRWTPAATNQAQVLAESARLKLRLSDAMITQTQGAFCGYVPGLGPEGALARLPLSYPYPSADADLVRCPRVDWTFSITNSSVEVEVRTLPTQPAYPGVPIRYAIQVDGQPPIVRDVAVQDGSPNWAASVLRGYNVDLTTHKLLSTNVHTLSLYLIDPGLAIQEVILHPK